MMVLIHWSRLFVRKVMELESRILSELRTLGQIQCSESPSWESDQL